MQDRTRRALKKAGGIAVDILSAFMLAVTVGASASVALFCLAWWWLG